MLVSVLAAACSGRSGPVGQEPEREDAEVRWSELVAGLGLTPAPGSIVLSGDDLGERIELTIAVPEDGTEQVFADGLFGARVFARADGGWTRVDTADIRTQVAPVLAPGESAAVTVPVEEAAGYRVLVPSTGQAVWIDVSGG